MCLFIFFHPGIGEPIEEVTVNTLYIAPNAEPTQDTTKDFTPRVEAVTPRDTPRETPKKPVRTEVSVAHMHTYKQSYPHAHTYFMLNKHIAHTFDTHHSNVIDGSKSF